MLRQVLSYCSSAQSQLHDLGKLGGWPAEECRRMVIAYPSLLGMSVRRNVAPKFYYLQVCALPCREWPVAAAAPRPARSPVTCGLIVSLRAASHGAADESGRGVAELLRLLTGEADHDALRGA